jgi:hypothetical protein
MKKSQLPIFAELTLADTEDFTAKLSCKFDGTNNLRHLRVINALLQRGRKREEIDRIAGASNGPELIAELRRRGLTLPCNRIPAFDRDGFPVRPGVYNLTNHDRRLLSSWMARRESGRL